MEARAAETFRPLAGIRVVEFSQMVMGPTCGLILADLGADVIKIEPPKGDRTRFFKGPASGFFANYCRNKRSIAVDTAAPEGQEAVRRNSSSPANAPRARSCDSWRACCRRR